MKRRVATVRKKSKATARRVRLFKPGEVEEMVMRGIRLSESLDPVKEGESAAELAIDWFSKLYAAQTVNSSDLDELSRKLSGTRRLLIYFVLESGIIADWRTNPQPSEIRACARRIEKDLASKKVVKANIAMHRRTIKSHLEAAFKELLAPGESAPKRKETGATLLQNAQCLLVYAAYNKSLQITADGRWPTLTTPRAAQIADEMRRRAIEPEGDITETFNAAVSWVRSRT